MVLGVAVALLQSLNQGGEHFRANGLLIQQLLGAHRLEGNGNGLQHIGGGFCGGAHGVLKTAAELAADLAHGALHGRLGAVGAQGDQIGLHPSDEIGLLGEIFAHDPCQSPDLPVAGLGAQGAVDDGKTVDIAHGYRHWYRKGILTALSQQLEALPILKAGKQIRFQLRVGEDEQLSQLLTPVVFQTADVAAQGMLGLILPFDIALQGNGILLGDGGFRKIAMSQEGLKGLTLAGKGFAQQFVGSLVVEDQVIVVVKQDNALADALENAGFQGVEHTVAGVVEAAPVQQVGGQAVAADGIVQLIPDRVRVTEQEHRVHRHDGENSHYDEQVLLPVFPGNPAQLPNQQKNHRAHQYIGKDQMADVQRLHLIGVPGNLRVPGHIIDGDAQEGVQGKHHQLKQGVGIAQNHQPASGSGKASFDEMQRKGQQSQQHKIDGDKIDAGHDGHAQVAVRQNADKIADVHQGGAGASKGQVLAGGSVLLGGFDGKNAVNGGNHNGNADVEIQKNTVHVAENLLCVISNRL